MNELIPTTEAREIHQRIKTIRPFPLFQWLLLPVTDMGEELEYTTNKHETVIPPQD